MENEKIVVCYNCGEEVNEENTTLVDNEHICNNCLDNDYFMCEDCLEYYHNDNLTVVGDRYVCRHCLDNYSYCENCDTYVDSDTMCETRGGDYVCDNCYSSYEEEYRSQAIYDYHEYRDWEKREIIPNNNNNNNNIQDIVENIDTSLTFGFELEVEQHENCIVSRNDMALQVKEITENDTICSYDGSLNNGFEIVSHPLTYNYFRKHEDRFIDMLQALKRGKYISHNAGTCGLHIHIDRNYLGDMFDTQENNIDRLILLFETFKNELLIFSRRTKTQVDRWSSFLSSDTNTTLEYIKDKKHNGSRYMAVNIQNRRTIEIRLWRGTLNINTFMATIELTKIMVDWCISGKDLPNTFEDLFIDNEIVNSYWQDRKTREVRD